MTTSSAVLHPVVTPSIEFLKVAKVQNPKGCYIEIDKILKESILVMKGEPTQTRVQVPREDRPSSYLQLHHSLVTLQVNLNAIDHFGMELTLSQSSVVRMRLVIGTFIREARHDLSIKGMCIAHLPLIIPRNRWVQVVFHISGIVDYLFRMPPVKSIDTIALIGTARISRLMTSSDEQSCINATPDGMALFAVPAYAPPIWSTASKIIGGEKVAHSTATNGTPASSETAAATDNTSNSADSSDNGKHLNALPPLSNQSLKVSGNRVLSAPKNDSVEQSCIESSSKPQIHMGNNSSNQDFNSPPSTMYSPPRSEVLKPHYVRLVDGSEDQPIQSKIANSNGSPRHQFAITRGEIVVPDATDISRWEEEESEDIPASSHIKGEKLGSSMKVNSKKEENETKNLKGGTRKVRGPSYSKGNTAPRNVSTKDGLAKVAVHRRHRVKRRLQILKANEVKNYKHMVGKSLHASEIPISPSVIPPELSGSISEWTEDGHDPKYGYGFGYLGILREDGEYEIDENADLKMKGALTLRLSDDDQDELE